MERLVICVNDVDQAARLMGPLLADRAATGACLVLPCAPGLGRRIGRWIPPDTRQRWREDWAAQLRDRLEPALSVAAPGVEVEWVVPQGTLAETLRQLRLRQGAGLRVLDARLHRPGATPEPMLGGQARARVRLAAPVAVASSLSLMLALTD